MKKAVIHRLGAYGDMIIASPLFPFLKRDGFHVTLDISRRGEPIVRNNPYVDAVHYHDETIPVQELDAHWERMNKNFDKSINLTQSIEGSLLYSELHDREKFDWPHEKRHAACNVNYYDNTMRIGGYHAKGLRGELYFSPGEHHWARSIRKTYKGKFLIVWSLSGSSFHKTYPHAETVAKAFCAAHNDVRILTVGDDSCMLLEWDAMHTIKKSGVWSIRKSMIMTSYADLVISTETGILNAAGCFSTPKIALLSHSSHENLTKYFKNCTPLRADVDCQPCHRLIYTKAACPMDVSAAGPVCMAHLGPAMVLNAMEDYYQKWKDGKYGVFRKQAEQPVSLCA